MKEIAYLIGFIIFLAFAGDWLTSAFSETTAENQCFDISLTGSNRPDSPILFNKCNGDTWMLLRTDQPLEDGETKPGFVWAWYRIERWGVENAIAGQ